MHTAHRGRGNDMGSRPVPGMRRLPAGPPGGGRGGQIFVARPGTNCRGRNCIWDRPPSPPRVAGPAEARLAEMPVAPLLRAAPVLAYVSLASACCSAPGIRRCRRRRLLRSRRCGQLLSLAESRLTHLAADVPVYVVWPCFSVGLFQCRLAGCGGRVWVRLRKL